jgi:gluconate:H+ symporter, GntP family
MHPHPLLILVIAIAIVFVLIIRLKINAFLALIIAAITVGMLSAEVEWKDVVPETTAAFGPSSASVSWRAAPPTRLSASSSALWANAGPRGRCF